MFQNNILVLVDQKLVREKIYIVRATVLRTICGPVRISLVHTNPVET